jgi:tRNA(Ile)-lysidine synthase
MQKQSTADIADLLFELSRKTLKLYEKIEKDSKSFTVNSAGFNKQHRLLQIEIIQRLLEQSGIGLQKFTSCHYNKIIKFIAEAKTGKSLQLPTGAFIQKTQNGFFIGFPKKPTQTNEQVVLPTPGKICFADWVIETEVVPAERINTIKDQSIKDKKDNSVEYFDLDGIDMPLSARFRQNGDKFVPFGHNTPQKIGKFAASANQAIIIQDNKQILWLAPLRRSRMGTIAKNTTKILKIRVLSGAQG